MSKPFHDGMIQAQYLKQDQQVKLEIPIETE